MSPSQNVDADIEIRALIVDMDGVLWRGEEPIGNPAEAFQLVKQRGWRVLLLTNNSTRTADQYLEKLAGMRIDISADQILNTARATADYLKEHFAPGTPIFIVGEAGLHQTLAEAGFEHHPDSAEIVVAGLDRSVSYDKLRLATLLIRNGASFIGTNPDRTIPAPQGLLPGAGAILAALEAATDVPPTIIGKPAPEIFRQALRRLGTSSSRTLVVGDRLETDIAGGQSVGCRTGLVLSGVAARKEAENWSPPPDFIAEDLSGLLAGLPTYEVVQD